MTCPEVRDLLAAFSLDSLEADERAAVEDHLARCPECASELRAYEGVATRLALAFPQHQPPTDLKGRLLAAARQRPGEVGGRSRWRPPGLGVLRLRPAGLIAALALVLALGALLWAAGLQAQLNEQRAVAASLRERAARYDRVVAVLQAPDIQLRPLEGTEAAPGAIGRLYVDPESGSGMVMVRSLPPLLPGRAYQLWWVRGDGRRESGGLLRWTDQQGNGYLLTQCPAPCNSFQSIGMTEEPAEGSPAPTGQRLLGGRL